MLITVSWRRAPALTTWFSARRVPSRSRLNSQSPDFDPSIVGYGGMWRMYDEAHVTTIGVRHDLQHRGYGRVLFAGLVQAAYDMGAKWVHARGADLE